MNNWERMKAGRLYNADSKDLEKYHSFGMETCDKFNRTPLWMKKRKQRLLEKMIPPGFLSDERLPQQYPDGFHDLEYAKPIHIGSGSWICSSATICGGVTIGKNCIVAAGAVVNRDVPDDCIVAGVPAKVLRKLDEQDRIHVWDTYMKNEVPLSERESGRSRS